MFLTSQRNKPRFCEREKNLNTQCVYGCHILFICFAVLILHVHDSLTVMSKLSFLKKICENETIAFIIHIFLDIFSRL